MNYLLDTDDGSGGIATQVSFADAFVAEVHSQHDKSNVAIISECIGADIMDACAHVTDALEALGPGVDCRSPEAKHAAKNALPETHALKGFVDDAFDAIRSNYPEGVPVTEAWDFDPA